LQAWNQFSIDSNIFCNRLNINSLEKGKKGRLSTRYQRCGIISHLAFTKDKPLWMKFHSSLAIKKGLFTENRVLGQRARRPDSPKKSTAKNIYG